MTPQRLAEIRARLAGPRHPLDLGYLYAQDVGELLEEEACARINANEARSLLATAEEEMGRRVAEEREACAKVAESFGSREFMLTNSELISKGIALAIRERK